MSTVQSSTPVASQLPAAPSLAPGSVSACARNSLLWYNTPGFSNLGLAIPNWGTNPTTQNGEILDLTNLLGQNAQAVMLSNDARVAAPPTSNTVAKIVSMCEQFFSMVAARYIPEGTGVQGIEAPHTAADLNPFLVFPTPLFTVSNRWLKRFGTMAIYAVSELMQSSENGRANYLSQALAGTVTQFIHSIYAQVAIEMLGVPTLPMVNDVNGVPQYQPADPRSLAFLLTPAQKANYAPSARFTQIEAVAVAPPAQAVPTAADLQVITGGIAVPSLPNTIGPWPTAVGTFAMAEAQALGTSKSAASTSTASAPSSTGGTTLPAAPGSLQGQSSQAQAGSSAATATSTAQASS